MLVSAERSICFSERPSLAADPKSTWSTGKAFHTHNDIKERSA